MGQRSAAETIIQIFQAFLQKRTWSQAELARRLGIGVPALRTRLYEMLEAKVPLDAEEDPPHVMWSVPNRWFPGGVALRPEDVLDLLRLLARAPKSAMQQRLFARVLEASRLPEGDEPVVAPALDVAEEAALPVLEDAARTQTVLHFHYYSAGRGALEWRDASVQRVLPGPPVRFVAVCHRSNELKWFRADRVTQSALDPATPYRRTPANDIDDFLATSVDGYRDGREPSVLSFLVTGTAIRWVEKNLPAQMHATHTANALRVEVRAAALLTMARFVVGLGEDASPETPELAAAVRALAEGALQRLDRGTATEPGKPKTRSGAATKPAKRHAPRKALNTLSVSSIPSTEWKPAPGVRPRRSK